MYDATGVKLRKIVKVGATVQYELDYAGGVEYRKVGADSKRIEAIYHSEGRVYNTNLTTSSTTLALRYEYTIKDHLGSARLSSSDKNSDGVAEVLTGAANEILGEYHVSLRRRASCQCAPGCRPLPKNKA